MTNGPPKVFISYAWEDEEHKKWVKELADHLIGDGIAATVDQYDLSLGDRLPQFMEQSISTADYVLIICTPSYKIKSDARTGGVGYEGHIISGELLSKGNERKFIPIIRKGSVTEAFPVCLSGKLGINLSGAVDYEDNYHDLITTLYGEKQKPQLGQRPAYVPQIKSTTTMKQDSDPIHILGIITDEVTVPRMDGTRGSALYKIPFRLSKQPSELWKNLFLQIWQFPPSFTIMHRPEIASIYGDKIILDGTTIDEVQQSHRKTLMLCVEGANQEEERLLELQRQAEAAEEKRRNDHLQKINEIAGKIEF